MSGVTAGTSVDKTLDLAARVPVRARVGKESVSLSGKSQYLHNRTDTSHKFQTITVLEDSTAARQMRQFLQSVERGEAFQLDISGTAAAPIAPVSAKLVGDWQENIERYRPTCVSFSFQVKY
jgi:hypothetical protein